MSERGRPERAVPERAVPERARRLGDDRGETLVELIVAIVLLGITVAAVMGGLFAAVHVSDVHRKQATAGDSARDYAESLDAFVAAGGYVECVGPQAYQPASVGFGAPAGFSGRVSAVAFWNRKTRSFGTSCSSAGLERVTVEVASADGAATERSVVVVRKP